MAAKAGRRAGTSRHRDCAAGPTAFLSYVTPERWPEFTETTYGTFFISSLDGRLQGRKAHLVAKILARTEGSHEIVGGAGGGKVSSDTVAAGITPSGDDRENDDAFADGKKALEGEVGERGTSVDIVDEKKCGGRAPSSAGGSTTEHDGADHAPWEGSELTGALTPNSNRVAGAGATAKAACIPRYDKGGRKDEGPKKTKKKNGGGSGTARSRPAKKADTAAIRRTRRRLEQAAACAAAAVSLPTETQQEKQEKGEAQEKEKAWKDAVEEMWNVLVSIPLPSGRSSGDSTSGLSLEKLFGDGITAESLVGVTRGLRHAFGIDSAGLSAEGAQEGGEDAFSNAERAGQVCTFHHMSVCVSDRKKQKTRALCRLCRYFFRAVCCLLRLFRRILFLGSGCFSSLWSATGPVCMLFSC